MKLVVKVNQFPPPEYQVSHARNIYGWHQVVSNLEMSNFFEEQGRTRGYAEAYMKYVAGENPRRTQLLGKRAISGWKPVRF